MGKRKKSSRKPKAKKKMEPLATTFACLFCNHEKSVTCKLDKKHQVGVLYCKVCAQSFQTDINSLSQPIDIYSDWIDACDAVTRDYQGGGTGSDEYEASGGDKYRRGGASGSGGASAGGTQSSRSGGGASRRVADDDDDDDLEEYE